MELRRIIPSDITASAVAHVSLLTLLVLFSEVHPFVAVTAEQIPVEIVTPQDLAEKQLPAEQREVVHLKVWEGMTFQEIADLTGESLNTAASRYRYAIEKLRTILAEEN